MPIKIKNDLPARAVLENEHIFVMTERRALTQDIRPLQILILNLMPTKIETETQILRCLSNTPLQLEIELLQMESHTAKNVSEEHMITFYQTFPQIKHKWYDGADYYRSAGRTDGLRGCGNTGMNCARLWNGPRPMFTQPSIYAGAPRRAFIIIMV